MRLLREVMDHPVDPAYALAARRRVGADGPGRRAGLVTVILALACGLVVARGVTELRRPEPGQAAGRAALEREIDRRTALVDLQASTIERLRGEISAAQQAQLTSPEDVETAARTRQLALIAGESPVVGPGLQITLRDAQSAGSDAAAVDPRADSGADDGRVLDRDVQVVVNGLWAAGAEAIAINGRRLTSLSAIRSAGQAILVDFRPLVPPYVISAVGDSAGMQTRFAADLAGGYVQTLRDNFGVGVEIAVAADLRLPGAGTFELRTAAPLADSGVETSSTAPSISAPSNSAPTAPSTEVTP